MAETKIKSQAINITKSDVGLSNVDNTSDITKNSATATLTNKTLTSPTIAGTPVLDSTSAIPFYNDSLYRQAIINGNFDVWQRGTSVALTTGSYTADRWRFVKSASVDTSTTTRASFTAGQTDVPNNPKYYASTSVGANSGVGDFVYAEQRIEDVNTFSGMKATLSFWAKANATKNLTIEFGQNFGSGGSTAIDAIDNIKITLGTAWQKYTQTITLPSITGKTIGDGNYLRLVFWMSAGSNFNDRTDSLGNQSGTFDIAQVQLCAGEVALPFMPKSFEEELRTCQRYYQVITDMMNIGFTTNLIGNGVNFYLELPTGLRTSPTVTGTSGVTALAGATALTVSEVWIASTYTPNECGIRLNIGRSSGGSPNCVYRNSAACTITLDAEL